MKRFCVVLAGLLVTAPATAAGGNRDCGGDAYSFAEVVKPGRSARGRPIVSVPETLCADLAGGQEWRVESLSVHHDQRRHEARPEARSSPPRPLRHLPY